jgi:hypothetical protein
MPAIAEPSAEALVQNSSIIANLEAQRRRTIRPSAFGRSRNLRVFKEQRDNVRMNISPTGPEINRYSSTLDRIARPSWQI